MIIYTLRSSAQNLSFVVHWVQKIINYTELESSSSPAPGSAQDDPKDHIIFLKELSKCFVNFVRLGALTIFLGILF